MIAGLALRALMLVALWLSYVAARRIVGRRAAAATVAAVTAGSSLAWDLWSGPTACGAVSMAAAATMLASWPRIGRRYSSATAGVWLAAIVVVAVLATRLLFEGPRAVTLSGSIVDALWSSRHGLFATSPVLYLGAIGLVPLWRGDRRLALTGGLIVLLLAASTAAAPDESGRPGSAQLAATVPALALGLAALAAWISGAVRRHTAAAAVALVGPLVVWNVTLMAIAKAGVYGIGEPVSFADLGAAQARTLHAWIGHPAAWPANLAWGIENGLAPARFDLLEANRLLARADAGVVDIGGDDGAWIGAGWYDRERDGTLDFRWAGATATLLLPLDHTADLTCRLSLRPFDANGLGPQTLTLVVNGLAQPPVTVAPGWQQLDIGVPRRAWRAGVNAVTLRFGREVRPADVGGGADRRLLSAAVDRIAVLESAPDRGAR